MKVAPEKPKNAYLIFVKSIRDKVQSENPTLGFQELSDIYSKMWTESSMIEKSEFELLARESQRVYEIKNRNYQAYLRSGAPELYPKAEQN